MCIGQIYFRWMGVQRNLQARTEHWRGLFPAKLEFDTTNLYLCAKRSSGSCEVNIIGAVLQARQDGVSVEQGTYVLALRYFHSSTLSV